MRREFIYGFIILLLMVYLYFFHVREGFESTLEMTQDRANPLAAQQQPLTNPATKIGISQDSGTNIRELSQVALNSPLEDSVFDGTTAFGLKSEQNMNTISPRIDNEDSYLGLIKFCKDTVDSSGKNAWQNPKFSKNCGICMSDTTILLDRLNPRTYNTSNGTGVLVYKEDKDIAYTTQTNNNFRYPRAIPSLTSATCLRATLTNDDIVPVLAIDSNMYAEMFARNSCIDSAAFNSDRSCGQCQSTISSQNGKWSYIKQPPTGSLNIIALTLYGFGNATIKVNGQAIVGGLNITLSNGPTKLTLIDPNINPFIKEGDSLNIDVSGNNIFLYGALSSFNPNRTIHNMDVFDSLSNDSITNVTPTIGTSNILFGNVPMKRIIPGNGRTSMNLQGIIPLTFIDGSNNVNKSKNQIAYYDCKGGPYKTEGTIIETGSYCPPTPPVGGYSAGCIRELLSAGGCTSAGNWYQSGTLPTSIMSSNLNILRNWLSIRIENADSEPDSFMGCYGINRSNACAQFVGTESVPNQQCLQLLYDNTITRKNTGFSGSVPIIPYTVGENFLNYRALNETTDRYCRSAGTLNPANNLSLSNIANGYTPTGGTALKGMAAVNRYLSDIYTRAIDNNLDIHKDDSQGGRKTSWNQCFGINIASKKLILVNNLSDTSACTQTMGKKNVYLLENGANTASWNTYENTGIADTYWIWGDQIYSQKTFTFYLNYCNGNGAFTGTLEGQLRISGSVIINGNQISRTGETISGSVPIIVGNNEIRVTATGTAARAGFWMVLKNSSGTILVKTNETWRCE